jgi:hypothetical protein
MSQRNALLKRRQQETAPKMMVPPTPSDITLSSHRMHMSPALQTIKKQILAQ